MLNKLKESVDSLTLSIFRIAIGLGIVIDASRNIIYHSESPSFKAKYFGFEWLELGHFDFYALCLSVLLGLTLISGFGARIVALLLCMSWTSYWLEDIARYNNHYYLTSLLLFLFAVMGAGFPIHRFKSDGQFTTRLTLLIFQLQICIVYFFGGIAKLHPDWLSGNVMYSLFIEKGGLSDLPLYFLVYGGLLLDLLCPFGFMFRRTRLFTLLAVAFFHVSNMFMFGMHIGGFPYMMLIASVIFFPPDQIRGLLRLKKKAVDSHQPEKTVWGSSRLIQGFAACYLIIQLLAPLRSVFYPGDVLWHRHGVFFTWRMMMSVYRMSDKDMAMLRIKAPDGSTKVMALAEGFIGDPWEVVRSPDAIHQYVKYMDAKIQAEQGYDPEIYVDATIHLNGQPATRIINNQIDLSAQDRKPWPQDWLFPRNRTDGLNLKDRGDGKLDRFWASVLPTLALEGALKQDVLDLAHRKVREYKPKIDDVNARYKEALNRIKAGQGNRAELSVLLAEHFQLVQQRDLEIYQMLPKEKALHALTVRYVNKVGGTLNDLERFKANIQTIQSHARKAAEEIYGTESFTDFNVFHSKVIAIVEGLPATVPAS